MSVALVRQEVTPSAEPESTSLLTGTLHVYVAFDWGEEVDLEHALRLVPGEFHPLPRRRRTPSSIAYRPPPLHFSLAPVSIDLPETEPLQAPAEATVFDFGAASVALKIPFQLPTPKLSRLAGYLADPAGLIEKARAAVEPLHQKLLPAIERPWWSELSEEYFVFELAPGDPLPPVDALVSAQDRWLASLVRLEAGPLSAEEVAEALRLRISYSPDDLFVPDWAAAVLIDRDCDETLEVIEFANLQLLEFREIDNRLDNRLAAAYRLIHLLARSWLPFWRTHTRKLRSLRELKVEANSMFERTGNALKLMGDQYLARLYRLLAKRFHLQAWEESIERSLDVVEGVYQVVSEQAGAWRTQFLELIIILLISFEIVMAFLRH